LILSVSQAFADSLPFDKSEYAALQARFMEQIPDGIAVTRGSLSGSQNNKIRYLCDFEVPGTILILDGIRT